MGRETERDRVFESDTEYRLEFIIAGENMTTLEMILDYNIEDLSDPQTVLGAITTDSPSIWEDNQGSEPAPSFVEVEAACTSVIGMRLGRDWKAALMDPPGPLCGANANHTIEWYKNAIANFETPE